MTLASIGKVIEKARADRGWAKRRQFAEAIELDIAYVRGIERGTRNITVKSLRRIAYFLNVDIHSLLYEDDRINPYDTLERYIRFNLRDFIEPFLANCSTQSLFSILESELMDKITLRDIINGAI